MKRAIVVVSDVRELTKSFFSRGIKIENVMPLLNTINVLCTEDVCKIISEIEGVISVEWEGKQFKLKPDDKTRKTRKGRNKVA